MVAMVNKRNVQELILLHEATFREIRIQFISIENLKII